MDYCQVPGVSYAGCIGYSAFTIGSLHRTTLGAAERAEFIFYSLVAGSNYLNRARRVYQQIRTSLPELALPVWEHGTSRVGPIPVLPIFEQLEHDLRSASGGDAYFAHLLIPHYAYVFDASCRLRQEIEDWLYNMPIWPEEVQDWLPGELMKYLRSTRAERYYRYFEQIRCQQTLLDRLVEAMMQAGVWADAIVIVHGDHGSRIMRRSLEAENAAAFKPEDLGDDYSTLFAIRSAGRPQAVVHGNYSLQQLLSEAFGIPFADSSHKIYLRAQDSTKKPSDFAGF